jgi:hypothetical protein
MLMRAIKEDLNQQCKSSKLCHEIAFCAARAAGMQMPCLHCAGERGIRADFRIDIGVIGRLRVNESRSLGVKA